MARTREPMLTRKLARRGKYSLGLVLDDRWCKFHRLQPGDQVDIFWHSKRRDILLIKVKGKVKKS